MQLQEVRLLTSQWIKVPVRMGISWTVDCCETYKPGSAPIHIAEAPKNIVSCCKSQMWPLAYPILFNQSFSSQIV